VKRFSRIPYEWRITGIYLVIGFLWIVVSDIALLGQATNIEAMRILQTYKGWIFVAVTGWLFYFFLKQSIRRARKENVELTPKYDFYRHLFAGYHQAVWIYDCDKKEILEVNDAALSFLGYSRQEFLNLQPENFFSPQDAQFLHSSMLCESVESHRINNQIITKKDQTTIVVDLIIQKISFASDNRATIVQMLEPNTVSQPIATTNPPELAHDDFEVQVSSLLANIPGMVYRCKNDRNYTMLFVSKGCLELTGYPDHALINSEEVAYGNLIHPSDRLNLYNNFQEKLRIGIPFHYNYRIFTKKGEIKWVWEQAIGVFNEEGDLSYIEGFIMDVSAQKQAERAMSNQNNLLITILNNLPFPLFYKDLKGRIVACNSEFTHYLGFELNQLLGKNLQDLNLSEKFPEINESDFDILFSNKDLQKEMVISFPDGSSKHVVYHKTLYTNTEGTHQGYIGVYFDISDRVRNDAIIQSQMDELMRINLELDQFSHVVSHDLRSPLITIKGSLDFLKQDILSRDAEMVDEGIDRIQSAADRMQKLIENLLRLSRAGRVVNPLSWFSMDNLVKEVVNTLQGIFQESNAQFIVSTPLPDVYGDALRISDAIQNLIENAVKYRNPDVPLRVEFGFLPKQNGSLFYVKDNGQGIDAADLEMVFNKFTSLNKSSTGLGLGLSLVKRVIESHGGRVWATSDGLNMGSSFYFTIPNPTESTN